MPRFRQCKMSLVVAWSSLLLGAAAVALLLKGVMALSERRAAFVSAVTHELRTPLTTFRMYAEMLAEGMVPDEASRHRYLDTLRIEARSTDAPRGKCAGLFAAGAQQVGPAGRARSPRTICWLRPAARLADRAAQAGFELAVEPRRTSGNRECSPMPRRSSRFCSISSTMPASTPRRPTIGVTS